MVTNDERRDAASYIRQIDCSGFTAHSMDDGGGRSLLCAYIAEAVGVGHAPYYFDVKPLCARLADLIEPEERTCHDVSFDLREFICSRCGCHLDVLDIESDPTIWLGGSPIEPAFCPNCGAKVTGDEK